jgi:hypothetical protein
MMFYHTELQQTGFHSTLSPAAKSLVLWTETIPKHEKFALYWHLLSPTMAQHSASMITSNLKKFWSVLHHYPFWTFKQSSPKSDLMKNLTTWCSVHRLYNSTVGPYNIPISDSNNSPLSMLHKKVQQHIHIHWAIISRNHKFYVHVPYPYNTWI